ncbi:MAG TPA: hypothetical protein PLA90_15600 [Candidatus Sumerlaeota bacterium]|nr:hypothetical protein [Candidatus Sumerlaeota bacterium]
MRKLAETLHTLLFDAIRISGVLFRLMIPVIVIVKILKELGAIEPLGRLLGPVMEGVGLPGALGIVWASALVTNLYGGILAYMTVAPHIPVPTVAQMTVLGAMALIAHTFPVELRVAQRSGVRILTMFAIRFGGAFLYGWILNTVCRMGGWLQTPAHVLWSAAPVEQTLLEWAGREVANLAFIFGAIFSLLSLLRLLRFLRVTNLVERLLYPLLRPLGIGRAATDLTVIGMTLGIGYGGGLIIHEAESGRLTPRDIFCALALMGLTHSLIEDSLLMLSLGGHLAGLLLGRFAFTLLFCFGLAKLVARLSDTTFERYCCRRMDNENG